MAARRPLGWADIPDMVPPLPADRELPALTAAVALLSWLSPDERGRVLRYLVEKYTPKVTLGGEGE